MITVGSRALDLVLANRAMLEERLEPGAIDGLRHGLSDLGAAVPGSRSARAAAKASTRTQDQATTRGHALVSAIHVAVRRRHQPRDIQAAYGVGSKVRATSVPGVLGDIGTILKRAADHPDEARQAGILERDLGALRAARDEIQGAQLASTTQHTSAPTTTKTRNAAAQRVLAAVDAIAAAGILEFAGDAVERAKFEALIGFGTRRKKAKGVGGGGGGGGGGGASGSSG